MLSCEQSRCRSILERARGRSVRLGKACVSLMLEGEQNPTGVQHALLANVPFTALRE